MVGKNKKPKQFQMNVNCKQNKTAKLYFVCCKLVYGKCANCVKVKCIDSVNASLFVHF